MQELIIKESSSQLKKMMNKETNGLFKERIQALYLIKTGKCQNVNDVAQIVGKSSKSVHRWLAKYKEGGMENMIRLPKKVGRKRKIPYWAEARLAEAFDMEETKLNTHVQVQKWLEKECQIKVSYSVVQEFMCYRFNGKKTS